MNYMCLNAYETSFGMNYLPFTLCSLKINPFTFLHLDGLLLLEDRFGTLTLDYAC